MHNIYVLWATPRSTSTAFEWMMRMRGDMTCFHEPFGEAWYQGDDALWPRLQADSPRQQGLSFGSVLDKLKTAAHDQPVFSKDMAQFTDHLWSDDFFLNFTHSFLIRDPAKVLSSVFNNAPEFILKEIGFIEQRQLFDRICDQFGRVPVVIDSDDLLEDPESVVEAYCDGIDIPYVSDALSWEPGARNEVLWYDSDDIWHTTLKNSTGLMKKPRAQIDLSDASDWVREKYEICLPHYQHIYSHRINPPK